MKRRSDVVRAVVGNVTSYLQPLLVFSAAVVGVITNNFALFVGDNTNEGYKVSAFINQFRKRVYKNALVDE